MLYSGILLWGAWQSLYLELWLIKKKGNILATSLERNLTETLNNEF
jgi:hypothetical protein